MRYTVTELDKMLLLQGKLKYNYKLYVLNKNGNIVDELVGIRGIGSYNIDSDSNVRRNASFTLELDNTYHSKHIEEKIETWVGYDFVLQIGILNLRTDEYVWYDCGSYAITSTNTTYDSKNNTLSTDLADWFTKLDGARNGQIGGAPTILIPNTDENGGKITIRQSTVGILKENNIQNYIIQDIGEYYGTENNPDYMTYRKNNPNWNQLPYDLEFNSGCTISDILIDIRDLYPNYEMYWDIYNNFCFNIIPSCNNDPILLDNDFLQSVLCGENSESVVYDIPTIKNVTEVFGKTYDTDNFCDSCTVSGNIYTLNIKLYETYETGQIISFVAPSNNTTSMKMRVNSLPSIPIYYENTTKYIDKDILVKDEVYSIKLMYSNGEYISYFLGSFQPHAICVLTSNENDNFYTKDYFRNKYNCKNIYFRVEKDNPFTVQRIGEILDSKIGNEFDNIISDSVAEENALYYNKKTSTLNDIVTITTNMIPWLDVNIKVAYKKQQEDEEHEYIIKSISHDMDSMTSSITMHRFYSLYFD